MSRPDVGGGDHRPAAARAGDAEEAAVLVGRFLARRDEKAFRALYRRYTPALYPLVVRLTGGDDSAAAEVLQSVWVRAVENLAGFRWQSTLKSWLTGIAINCARERVRRCQRERRVIAPLDGSEVPIPARLTRGLSRIDLERAIAGLPDGYREVLVLHDIEGYTHGEIGRLLGIEAGTSKSQLARARRAMRVRLTAAARSEDD